MHCLFFIGVWVSSLESFYSKRHQITWKYPMLSCSLSLAWPDCFFLLVIGLGEKKGSGPVWIPLFSWHVMKLRHNNTPVHLHSVIIGYINNRSSIPVHQSTIYDLFNGQQNLKLPVTFMDLAVHSWGLGIPNKIVHRCGASATTIVSIVYLMVMVTLPVRHWRQSLYEVSTTSLGA